MPRIFQKTTPKRGLDFDWITLAHNVLEKEGVQQVLDRAAAFVGTVLKPEQDAFWGGFSRYFVDPDGTSHLPSYSILFDVCKSSFT